MQNAHEKPPVNWGYEIRNAFRIIGKVLFKVFSYILNILLTLMLVALITGIIVGSAMAVYIKNYIDPEIDMSVFPVGQDSTTRIYYSEGNDYIELEDERIEGSESSIWARYDSMPENLINAFIAIEDKRFRDHNGFDIYRSGNAVLEFAKNFSFQSGGSTITQQLVKNITGDKDVRIQRKIEEIFRAMNLEKKKTKNEILELYLNIVPLGRGCTGVQTAANYYFSKDVSELSLIESVCIAAITNNPTKFDPTKNDGLYNSKRRNVILKQMFLQGYINKTEFDSAFGENIVLNIKEKDVVSADVGKINSYFKDALIDKVVNDLVELKGYTIEAANLMLYTGGLQIYTTLDPAIQKILEDFYRDDSNFPAAGGGLQPESAMVVMDPYTGHVVGLVGGRGEKTINRGLNRATGTTRPPGSAIKPIAVYAPALDDGTITYGSAVDDAPVMFNGSGGKRVAWPKNLPLGYNGLISVHEAIRVSKNTVAVRVLGEYGIEASFKFMKETLSIDSLVDEKVLSDGRIVTDKGLAALALGQLNYGLTVEEITAAYCIFPNDGVFNEPRLYTKIYDSLGNIVIDNDPKTRIVISAETASIMTYMLQKVTSERDGSTAKCITLNKLTGIQVAGKTGTTTADYDRWFVGYTPYYVAGVWFGYDMPQSLAQFSPSKPPSCVIWDKVMTQIHQKYLDDEANGIPLETFKLSAGVVEAEYCKDSGMKPTDACRGLDPRGSRIDTGYFTRQTAPSDSCNVHVVVNICSESNLISIPGYSFCTSTYKKALIRIESRSFPTYVGIADAGYVYRELPSGVKPYGGGNYPFFKNVLSNGEYVGSSTGWQYNILCTLHRAPVTPQETEPEPTDETDPPDNNIGVTPPDNNPGEAPADTPNQGGEQETEPDISQENTTPPETEAPPPSIENPTEYEDAEYTPDPWDGITD